MAKLLAGQVVRFTYRFHTGAGPDEFTSDSKEVLVLHPNWAGKMHGIDMKRLTAAEREVLNSIFDSEVRDQVRTGKKLHKLPLVNDILRRMDPLEEVKNPMTFYSKFVKVFLRNKDAYRTYYPTRMLNTIIVEQTKVAGNVFNPKPLFHKVESKAPPQSAAAKANRLDMIKKQAQAKKIEKGPKPAPQKQEPAKVDRLALIKQRSQATRPKKPQ